MKIFSFHLVQTTPGSTLKALWRPPAPSDVPGLLHAECMTRMTLGAPILSPSRAQMSQLVVFASWENEAALEEFLHGDADVSRVLRSGWHVRLAFLRRWGHVSEFDGLEEVAAELDPAHPVVAVTIARMQLLEVPRFIAWGRPVEALVRDHPGKTLALAAIRLPNTVCTFSIWRSAREMTDMVHGHSAVDRPERHRKAMAERNRKDFHYEFTTLRFRALSEHGRWEGRSEWVPPGPGGRT